MKLAEALLLKADLKIRIDELASRLNLNALTQENERPAEEPSELLVELEGCMREFESLTSKINLANARVVINSQSLTEILAKKDALSKKATILRDFLDNASSLTKRGLKSEIKNVSSVDVKPLRKYVDDISKQIRELDTMVQQINWTTEI